MVNTTIMAGRSLFLSSGKLTISDLLAAIDGAKVIIDEETLKTLSVSEEGGSHFESSQSEADPFLRASLVVRLHALLKAGDQVRATLVRGLLGIVNGETPRGTLKDLGTALLFTSNEVQAFLSPTTPEVVALGVTIGRLQAFMPLIISGFALFLEAFAINHGFLNGELYQVSYRGLKSTLQDLESLLENSKLVKTSLEGFGPEVLEVPQALGYLRDALDTASRVAEAELNEDIRLNQQLVIPRSLYPIRSQQSVLTQSLLSLIDLTRARLLRLDPSFQSTVSPGALPEALDYFIHLNATEIALSAALLQTKEAKMNEGIPEGKSKKQLPYGKGIKQIITLFAGIAGSDLVPQLSSTLHIPFLTDLLHAKNEERRVPKIPKGMRDYGPAEMAVRSQVFNTIRRIFQRHQAGELDTPVMELKETLTGKYGEEGGKLIYELADQGGEILALRYDLTVPLARYVAMNRITRLKRYHIGKVYRRDQPQLKRGRYREFYQCDFDIVGPGAIMIQEAECLKIVAEILLELQIPFLTKINHRRLLDACLEIAGCPPTKFRTVSSSIDKLDKEPWEKVREELIAEKGVAPETADMIGELVKIHGPVESTVALLLADPRMQTHPKAPAVLQEMQTLTGFLKCLGIEQYVEFDLSLARGLDYYTGLVYEAVVTDNSLGLGSIGGGGRYDELIQKLNNSKQQTCAVGVSLGIERLFTLVEKRAESGGMLEEKKGVLIAQAGRSGKYNLFEERLKLCCRLWESGLSAETSYKEKSDPEGQARYADEEKLPFILWLGESELDQGVIKVKDMRAHSETLVPIADITAFLRR